MSEITSIIILTTLAGVCIPIGGLVARFEHIRPLWMERELRHFVIALGGGILLGAVTQVLLPEGLTNLDSNILGIVIFMLGGVAFFAIERWLGLRRRESPQLMGMMLDYVPEAIALGGMVALESPLAPLLALLIGLQNLPEGFNAYREIDKQNSHKSNRSVIFMFCLVPIGPIAGLAGMFLLTPTVLGAIMLFASGGILYLIFQDIAPQSRLAHHWGPPLGAIVGFTVALISKQLLH